MILYKLLLSRLRGIFHYNLSSCPLETLNYMTTWSQNQWNQVDSKWMGNKSKWKCYTPKKCSVLKRNKWRNFQNHRTTTFKTHCKHGPNQTGRNLEINNRLSIIQTTFIAKQADSELCFSLICCILSLLTPDQGKWQTPALQLCYLQSL